MEPFGLGPRLAPAGLTLAGAAAATVLAGAAALAAGLAAGRVTTLGGRPGFFFAASSAAELTSGTAGDFDADTGLTFKAGLATVSATTLVVALALVLAAGAAGFSDFGAGMGEEPQDNKKTK
jgi:hypothetical protein